MSEIAISLNNVSKCYKRYSRPVDRLKELLFVGKSRADEFWALRDINLEVSKGQALGIVGRNGSGKSTLLQIIAGTLIPTTGAVQVHGRVSAILELGSGFNPEFTGRQNVFFYGRLLGLQQKELEAKFDEIAYFADIGDFINHPVRTYSSGMFVRLAFAVAINVEPDILIIDEALAVGDEAFQRKCFARIQTIQEKGGTILFVSHSATSVISLCRSAVLIDQGEQLLTSTPKEVVSKYHKLIYSPINERQNIREEIRQSIINSEISNSFNKLQTKSLTLNNHKLIQASYETYDPNFIPKSTLAYVSCGALIENPHITNLEGKQLNTLVRKKEYIYTYYVKFSTTVYGVRFGMSIKTLEGLEIGGAASHTKHNPIEYIEMGKVFKVTFRFRCLLQPGTYFLNAGVLGVVEDSEGFLHRLIDAAMFKVHPEETDTARSGFVDFCIKPNISSVNLVEIETK